MCSGPHPVGWAVPDRHRFPEHCKRTQLDTDSVLRKSQETTNDSENTSLLLVLYNSPRTFGGVEHTPRPCARARKRHCSSSKLCWLPLIPQNSADTPSPHLLSPRHHVQVTFTHTMPRPLLSNTVLPTTTPLSRPFSLEKATKSY